MTDSNRKVLEKLRRLERLARGAATDGERAAAESARKRLVDRLAEEGVHVAPELVAQVRAHQQTQPLAHVPDGATMEIDARMVAEELGQTPVESGAAAVTPTVEFEAVDGFGRPITPLAPDLDPRAGASGAGSRPYPQPRAPRPARRRGEGGGAGRIPPSDPTQPSARPGEIVIRAPVEAPASRPLPYDPFAEATPLIPELARAESTPARGAPTRSGRPPIDRRPTAVTEPRPWRWTWKRALTAAIATVAALGIAALFLQPSRDELAGLLPPPDAPVVSIDRVARVCVTGQRRACAQIGASIAERLHPESAWETEDRGACAGGDDVACARLGRYFAEEARRRGATLEGNSAVPSASPAARDHFDEVACALRSTACSEP